MLCAGCLSCGETSVELVSDDARIAVAGTDRTPFARNSEGRVLCDGSVCACDDGMDNDGDGYADQFDPACTGPFDDDEASLWTAISSENRDACLDCFFDGNSGNGDDGCAYPAACLEGSQPAEDACGSCEVSPGCADSCLPRTPKGCDCFGCCEVTRADGSRIDVQLTEGCTLDVVEDPMRCPRCVQQPDCRNPCGPCELCPGVGLGDLPASCGFEGLEPTACAAGQAVCGGELECPAGFTCVLGCCQAEVD